MKHPHILARHDMYQLTSLDMTDLDETRLECKNVGVIQCKGLRRAFPGNLPILSRAPTISVDEEAEVRII